MEAGKLRHRIIIQTMNESENWTDLVSCFAQVNGLSGNEYWAASAEQAQNTVDFVVRFSADLSSLVPQTTRIIFRGNRYDVQNLRVDRTGFTPPTFAEFQKLTGSEAGSQWIGSRPPPSDVGAAEGALRQLIPGTLAKERTNPSGPAPRGVAGEADVSAQIRD